jgi:hypothetical protein
VLCCVCAGKSATLSHGSAVSNSGEQLHAHGFVVHTGHTYLPGRSDSAAFNHRASHEPPSPEAAAVPPSRPLPTPTWQRMANALSDLKDTGFDVGEAENYLPMMEAQAIHPAMETEVFHFYQHLLRRLEPEARSSEPVAVVEAALGFVEGYQELKGLKAFPHFG